MGLGRQWLAEYQRLAPEQQEEVREWVRQQRESLYSATRCGTQGDTALIRVCASGKRQKQGFLFMTNYTDKPFSDEKTLHDKRHYILHNPIERVRRGSNPEWLHAKRGGIETALTVPAVFGYLRRECMAKDVTPELLEQMEGWLMVSATRCRIEVRVRKKAGHSGLEAGQDAVRVIEGCMIECDSYGNRELLDREKHRLLPLVCHRRDAWQYERQRGACMAAARDGAVIVCACISPKENALFKEIVAAGYKAIRIEDNGFPKIYHPSEERLHLCATGNYLIVTPWRYHYVPKDEGIRTAYCKTMNCLAQALCGCSDDWWK